MRRRATTKFIGPARPSGGATCSSAEAALALTDAIVEGNATPEVIRELERHFGYAQRVELTVTAAFYAMVPRVLDALGCRSRGQSGRPRR